MMSGMNVDNNKIVNYTNKSYLISSYHTRHNIEKQKLNLVLQLNSVQYLNSMMSIQNSTILDKLSPRENSNYILRSYNNKLTTVEMTDISDSHFTNNTVHSNDLQNTYLKYARSNNTTSSIDFYGQSNMITSFRRNKSNFKLCSKSCSYRLINKSFLL